MASVTTDRRRLLGLAAMLALLAQAFLSGWAMAAAATSPTLDAFGNPLCIGNVVDGDGDGHQPAKTSLPACCSMGCTPALGWGSGQGRDSVALQQTPPLVIIFASDASSTFTTTRTPLAGRPRAPPLLTA